MACRTVSEKGGGNGWERERRDLLGRRLCLWSGIEERRIGWVGEALVERGRVRRVAVKDLRDLKTGL